MSYAVNKRVMKLFNIKRQKPSKIIQLDYFSKYGEGIIMVKKRRYHCVGQLASFIDSTSTWHSTRGMDICWCRFVFIPSQQYLIELYRGQHSPDSMTVESRHSMHTLRPSPNYMYFVFLACRENIMVGEKIQETKNAGTLAKKLQFNLKLQVTQQCTTNKISHT